VSVASVREVAVGAGTSAWSWLRQRTVWQWLLVGAIAWYTWYFTRFTLNVHHGLGTSAYDYGLYDQGLWLTSRFQVPFVTLMGRNLFGDHTSFILLFLVPAYWVAPGAGTLLFSQSLIIGMGALPVFLYARHRLRSEAVALVLACCYLLHPAVAWTNLENFHPDSALGFLVGMAIYGALMRRWRLYTVFVILSLLVKEDVSLVIVPLGVWVAIKRDRRIGLLTIVGSISFMLIAMYGIMRSLIGVPTRNSWRIPFGGPTEFLTETVERPGNVVDHFRSDGRPWYVWQMAAPFAFVFARLPDVALIGAGVMFTNILSTFWYQYQIQYHYSLVIVPALALGTVHALGVVSAKWRDWLVLLVAATSMWGALLWGPLPFSRNDYPHWGRHHPVAVAARDIIRDVPAGASVTAYHSLTAHLAHRKEVFLFPTPFRATLYGVDNELEGVRLPAAERVQYVVLPRSMDPELEAVWIEEQDDFELVRENEWWRLYVRRGSG
jgi:uncharacterized membrane protein